MHGSIEPSPISEEMTIILVLLALTLLRVGLLAAGAALLIRPVRACPACRRETVRIRVRWLDRVGRRYEWRWCPHCRWEGLALRTPGIGRSGAARRPGAG